MDHVLEDFTAGVITEFFRMPRKVRDQMSIGADELVVVVSRDELADIIGELNYRRRKRRTNPSRT